MTFRYNDDAAPATFTTVKFDELVKQLGAPAFRSSTTPAEVQYAVGYGFGGWLNVPPQKLG